MKTTSFRLACYGCDAAIDGTADQKDAKAAGWRNIKRQQSYQEATTTYEPDDAPPGYSVLDWYTHIGDCPDCAAELERMSKRATDSTATSVRGVRDERSGK